jgi:thiol-disulfide isomerase/thioredoxin
VPPDLPPPVLEVFYSPTCAPCRLELPLLAELAGQADTTLRIVIVDQTEKAQAELRAVSPRLEAIATAPVTGPSSASPGDALRAAGDANGILPYARSLTAAGEVCAQWSGGLTVSRVKSLLAACARLATSPRRPPS